MYCCKQLRWGTATHLQPYWAYLSSSWLVTPTDVHNTLAELVITKLITKRNFIIAGEYKTSTVYLKVIIIALTAIQVKAIGSILILKYDIQCNLLKAILVGDSKDVINFIRINYSYFLIKWTRCCQRNLTYAIFIFKTSNITILNAVTTTFKTVNETDQRLFKEYQRSLFTHNSLQLLHLKSTPWSEAESVNKRTALLRLVLIR